MRGWGRCALATSVVIGVGALVTAPPSGVVRACECAQRSTVENYDEWLAADARIEPTRSVPRVGPVRAIGAFLPGSVPEVQPGVTPPPMFERSGSPVETAPATTSPTDTTSVPDVSSVSAAPTRIAASGDDGGGRAWWPWAGVGLLVLAGVAAGVLLPGRR